MVDPSTEVGDGLCSKVSASAFEAFDEEGSSASVQLDEDIPQRTDKARAEKAEAIRKACNSYDTEALVSHATSEGGFLEDELRRRACKRTST